MLPAVTPALYCGWRAISPSLVAEDDSSRIRLLPGVTIAGEDTTTMPTFAAIDIGSNSIRLKIATVHLHRLKTLHEDREVVRLGESVFQTGVISPDAMANPTSAPQR